MNYNFFTMLNKRVLILGAALLLTAFVIVLGLVIIIYKQRSDTKQPFIVPPATITSRPTPYQGGTTSIKQEKFNVINTSPQHKETDVYAGELGILINTDVDIQSEGDINLSFSPKLEYYWKFENSFPSKNIKVRVYGGLIQNTQYKIDVTDSLGKKIYSWSFTTANKRGEDSSRLIYEESRKDLQNNAPLFDYIPHSNSNFSIDYTAPLTLKVVIKNPDVNKVKGEVDTWIRDHGVDPSTHSINYITPTPVRR